MMDFDNDKRPFAKLSPREREELWERIREDALEMALKYGTGFDGLSYGQNL